MLILAAPLILPFAKAIGITAGAVASIAAFEKTVKGVENYIKENPENSEKIISMISPMGGLANTILNRTTDTPSGKVFAPTGEAIEPTQLPGMAPAEQQQGLPGLLAPQQEKQVEGMSQASPPTKNKGFTMPATEDMKILNNVEEGEPKFKYPTTEELKSYIKEENKFWEEEVIPKANEKKPQLNIKNLPKIVEADKHFGAAAMSFSNFSESQLIYMSPQEYLDLTKRFRPVGTQGEGSKLNSDNIEQLIKDGKELANIPFLNVTKVGDSYKVTGQEGIHRAIAFKNLGYDKMPVVIEGTGTDKVAGVENKVYTATPKSYLYTEPWAKDYIGFIPKSIQSDDEVLLTKPEDFYNVRTKEKLFNKDKSTVKVFRGDTTDKEKNFTSKDFYKKNPVMEFFDKQNMGEKFQEINKKRDVTRGRWFTTDKNSAESYKDKKSGVLLEAEISKKDLKIGNKMKNRYFKDVETDENTILLPRKNLKDVKKKAYGGLIGKPLSGGSRYI